MSDPRFGGEKIAPFEGELIKAQAQGIVQDKDTNPSFKGRRSIMSEYAIVTFHGMDASGRNTLIDTSNDDKKRPLRWYEDNSGVDSRDPSVSALIDFAQKDKFERRPYAYKDFAFCKFFDVISNNRLITLRRFAAPTTDDLQFPGMLDTDNSNTFPPIATAITYFGEGTNNALSTIFNITTELPWSELKADLHDNTPSSKGAGNLPKGLGNMGKILSMASGSATAGSVSNAGQAFADPYASGPYVNRVKGPVNRIDSVMKRSPGLKMTNSFDLVFEYNLRSFGHMNAKAALLDILSNMYLLTYGSAPFWGGDNRFTSGGAKYPLKGMMSSWYKGDAMGFMTKGLGLVSQAVTQMGSLFGNIFKGGKFNLEGLLNIGSKAVSMGMAHAVAGQKDTYLGLHALMTGVPIGEWHLTIGNPLNPILEMGNMIISKMTAVASDDIGPDDFPNSIKFTISLQHAMPRDSDAVQSMFNNGKGRIYKLPDDFLKNLPSLNETEVDNKTGPKNNPIDKSKKSSKFGTNLSNNGTLKNAAYKLAGEIGLGSGEAKPLNT